MAESFFATLECELIERRSFTSKGEAKVAVFSYIEGWYNPRLRHSALGYHSPVEFERCVVPEACRGQATEINEKTKYRFESQAITARRSSPTSKITAGSITHLASGHRHGKVA